VGQNVKIRIIEFRSPDEEYVYGTVEYTPERGLVYDTEQVRDLVEEELRYDLAYGYEWRDLTDEEIPEHVFMRLTGRVHAVALDEHDEPSDEAARAIEAKWARIAAQRRLPEQ
jgi:hypothetical protein